MLKHRKTCLIPIVIDISLNFHCSVFFITSDFSIHLMHFTSNAHNFHICERKYQVCVYIFLARTCQIFWYQNYLGLLKFFVFAFSAPPFSVRERLHVAYTKYEIKRKFTFLR